jgi:arginase
MGSHFKAVSSAPKKLREQELIEKIIASRVDITDLGDLTLNNVQHENPEHNSYRFEIEDVCKSVCGSVLASLKRGALPFIIGGDHSMSMGSVAGVAKYYRQQNKKIGVIWFDAHGDVNTPETSISGNIHGMPVAHLIGLGWTQLRNIAGFFPAVDPQNFILIGVRDLDAAEKKIISENNLFVATARDVHEQGIESVLQSAFEHLSERVVGVHVSFDLDCLDPNAAPGVSLAVGGGLNMKQALDALRIIKSDSKLLSFEIAELNPEFDHQNKTAHNAIELAREALK